jgi:hypothetical protein
MSEIDAYADAILNDRKYETPVEQPATEVPSAEGNDAPPAVPPADEKQPEVTAETKIPETPQPAADPNDWISNVAKMAGTEFKTEDELKSYLDRAKNFESSENDRKAISEQYEALKGTIPQFANERMQKLNELYLSGATEEQITAFNKINSVGDLKDLKPIDGVRLALQLRDGLTEDEANNVINRKFKLDENLYEAEDIISSNIDLKLAFKSDLDYLSGFKSKASEVPVTPAQKSQEELTNQVAQYRQQVAPIANSIGQEFTSLKGINVNGVQGEKSILLDLPVSEDTQKIISQWVSEYATANNVPFNTPEGMKELQKFARFNVINENFDNMVIHINNKAEERVRAEFNNSSPISRGQDAPASTDAQAKAKADEEWVLNR